MDLEAVRRIAENPELKNCLYLVAKGVPFDVAFSLPQHEVMAYAIIFGELDGGRWDWATNSWDEPK